MHKSQPSNSASPRVTHRMIADKAGVSQATVSRALRDDPRISEAVKRKVKQVAQKLGHRPDPTFQRYMTEMRRMQQPRLRELLALVGDPAMKHMSYVREIREGALARAEELGFHAEVMWCGDCAKEFRTVNRMILARNMKGVLLLPFENPRVRPRLDWSRLSAVTVTKIDPELRMHGVHGDLRLRFERISDWMTEQGVKRPGLVLWSAQNQRGIRPLLATYFWHWHMTLCASPIPPFSIENNPEYVEAFNHWMKTYQPDCLWVGGRHMQNELLEWLHPGKRPLPGFVSYTNVEEAENIAGIRIDFNHVGRGAIDLLTAMVIRGETGLPEEPKRVSFQGHLVGEIR